MGVFINVYIKTNENELLIADAKQFQRNPLLNLLYFYGVYRNVSHL